MTVSSKPALSIVIASVNGYPVIGECLQRLYSQSCADKIEVVVANRCGSGVGEKIVREYPDVKLLDAPQRTTIPVLRALAMREAAGNVIAVIEDHCIVDKDWAEQILEAHHGKYPVIAGSVENAARDRIVDWAAFFCEYGNAMKPVPEGEADYVVGNNVAYKKWLIERFWSIIEKGVWDSILHENIKSDNIPLYRKPSITVYHKMSASLWWFIVQKFHFARSFAGMRFSGSMLLRRAVYGAGSIILPVVLSKRIILGVWNKGVFRRELLMSLPFILLLFFSWSLGELIGYIFGPGESYAKVS